MKKKLLGILFVLGLLLALPSMVSFAETKSGTCGATGNEANVTWVLDDNGTLTISGIGAMADYADASSVPWNGSVGAIRKVMIEESVTNIGAYAFSDCTNLNSVTIPTKVTKIGDDAFKNCTNLTDVYYAGTQGDWNGVNKGNENGCLTNASISYCICGATGNEANVKWALDDNGTLTISGSGAMADYGLFMNKPWDASIAAIKTVVIENGVTNVGAFAFYNCTSLASVTIPNSVESIGGGAFGGCSKLQSVTIPDSVKTIGVSAFTSCTSLKSVTIPNGVTNVSDNTFYNCTNLTSVTIPDSVETIGASAFYGCTSLKSVTIPNGVTSVGDKAFYNCTNLTSVTIPDSVESIGSSAFYGCTSLKSVTIPEKVGAIRGSAFYNCTSLESVVIPGSVKSIGNNAFEGCNKLADVYYTGTKAEWDALTKGSENDSLTNATLHYYVDKGTCGATGNEANVKWALDNDGTLTISGSGAMADYDAASSVPWNGSIADIKTVLIENGVTNVGDYAFNNCSSLKSVTIPDDVKNIGANAFYGCQELTSITMPEGLTSIGSSAFQNCTKLTSVAIPNSVTNVGAYAFYNCTNLTSVTIPDSVTSIGSGAFQNCTKLTSVTIPNSVTNVGANAFNSCANLTSVTISNRLDTISERTFEKCTGLNSVTIPNSVKTVNYGAFFSCTGLTTIYIPDGLNVGDAGIPVTATKLYYIAGAAEGNITPVTIDSVTYGNGKEKSITLPCDIMGNGYVIQSAKEGTQATINHNYSEIYTPVTGGNLSAKCKICRVDGTEVGEIKSGPVDPYANLVISETVTVGESGNLLVTTIRGSQQGEDYTTVTVPKDVKYISAGAFSVNRNLDTIYLPEGCQMESESVPLTTKVVYYKVNKDKNENAVVRTASTGEEITQVTVSGVEVLKPDQELNLNNIYGKYEITAIDNDAFNKSGKNLHTIILPNSVESINAGVFENCKKLETIYLKEGCTIENEGNIADKNLIYYTDDGATISSAKINIDNFQLELSQIRNGIGLKIGENAFKDQVKMKSVTIPATVTSIDAQAFAGCTKLTSIDIPASVTSIGTNSFVGCTGLQAITVNSGNTVYKSENGVLLSKDEKTLVCYPAGKTGSTYAIPEGVTVIAAQAFGGCTKLETITIPASVTSIGTNPFAGCTGLQTITVEEGNTAYKIENGVLLSESENKKTLLCYPAGNTGTTCTTPESVTAIAAQAFADCKKLENVVLRENVTSVGADAFTGCDKLKAVYAQKDCDIDSTVLNSENIIYYIVTNEDVSSKEVTIGKTTEDYNDSLAGGQNCIINRAGTELDLNVLNNTGLYKITCIGAGAFYQEASKQHNLKRIIIPEGVTEVKGGFLRYSQGLESVKLPTTLEGTLPRYSITDNKVLKTLTIPHQVTNIDSEAFTATTGLETVYVPSTITDITPITNNSSTANIIYFNIPTAYGSKTSTPIEICIGGNSADSGNKNNLPGSCKINREGSTVDLRMIDGNYKIKEIGTSAFSGWQNGGSAENLKEIVIPEGVTDIAKEAFRFCGKLTSITLPTTYSNGLHRYFITDNQNLKTLVVPHGVTEINSEAFTEVTGLTRVFLKDGLDRGTVFKKSESAKFIRYTVTDENASPKKVKITGASAKVDVYCDEMGDRYVITGNDSSDVTLKHRGDVEVPAEEATCKYDGKAAYWKCLCEGEKYENTDGKPGEKIENEEDLIIAARHEKIKVDAKAATFHACGVKAHYKCEKCKALFEDQDAAISTTLEDLVIPEHKGHDFGAYSHDYENQALHADVCALKGTVAATCAICDQTDVKSCAEHTKSSHVWTKGEKIPATCKTTGTQAYTCSLCNESEKKTLEIDPNNHTNVEKTEAKAATCTEAGNDEYWYCGGCKKYFEDEACTTVITDISEVTRPATGHTYGEVEYTWSNDYGTCTAKRVCQNDTSHVETENATKITENIIKAATCEGVGKKTYKAEFNSFTSCETEELDIPATGHKCNDTWEHNETQHWKVCETCEKEVNAANHTDENSDGTCDVCGYVTTPDTYTVSGTVYTWDNTDSNTTRVRLYDSTASEDDIKSDIQHDITDKSYTKTCQYDATVEGPETATKGYTQSFSFADVKSGNYKLVAWRPAYDSGKHYAYALKLDPIDIDENKTNVEIKTYLYGDANCDGAVNVRDVNLVKQYSAKSSNTLFDTGTDISKEFRIKLVDVNGDGRINVRDVNELKRYNAKGSSLYDNFI